MIRSPQVKGEIKENDYFLDWPVIIFGPGGGNQVVSEFIMSSFHVYGCGKREIIITLCWM
jgi:hypothetical protein